jgi:outer membrane protein TolC
MRWKVVVAWLALAVLIVAGCKQQCFLNECDYYHYRDIMPDNINNNCGPGPSVCAPTVNVPVPKTVDDPDRPIRYLSLAEAISLALQNGTVGFQNPIFSEGGNPYNDTLVSFQGINVFGSDRIRVLALDPAIVGTNIEASLAKFDVQWNTSMTWNTTDQPVATAQQTFQANGNPAIQTQAATFQSSLLKPLPTGGVAGITFTTNYTFSNLHPAVNPAYQPILQFQFEQPLLQAFGVDINQLRPTHPGSVLTPFNVGGRVEGIVITRLRFDQQRAEFERNVQWMIFNVEVAYWNLYGAYWNLYSREQALRQAYEAWRINKSRFEAGRIPIQDFAQTRQQYELFRAQRLAVLGSGGRVAGGSNGVLEAERQLRGMIGLPVEDNTRLVPSDQPTLAPYRPDWSSSVNEAMALRPELVLARQDLKFRQLDLINQRNLLLPDLRFFSTYDINSTGTHLGGGGNDPNNALANLAKDKFNDWQLGLRLNVPIGFRDAHSAVRLARLNLARSYAVLQDQEEKVQLQLARYYRKLFEDYEVIVAQRAQREAAAEQLQARFKEFIAGRGTLDILLEAQRVWADALRDEYLSIVDYNQAMAAYELSKGTLLQFDNVVISEGELPHCAVERAKAHVEEREKALLCKERAEPICQPVCHCEGGEFLGLPELPTTKPAGLPAMLDNQSKLPQVPEHLPAPPGYEGALPMARDANGASPLRGSLGPVTTMTSTPSPALPPALNAVPAQDPSGSKVR